MKVDSQLARLQDLFFWQSGNKTARAVKLGAVRNLVDIARKGFMKKMHRRPWCQD